MHNNKFLPYLTELAIFHQVVDCGSFTQAAQRLGLDPSGVSRRVSKLEKQLNIQLLHRTTRHIRLTEQGQLIYSHTQQMLHAAQQAIETAEDLNLEPTGSLHLYAPRALGKILLHPIVMRFMQAYPQINVIFSLDDRPIDPISAGIDIEFRITEKPPQAFVGRKLMDVEQIACASPRYLQQYGKPLHPKDLTAHRCISLSAETIDTRWYFQTGQKSVVVDISPIYCINHANARLDAALTGIGIATVPKFMAEQDLKQGNVQQVLSDWQLQTNYTGRVWMLHAPHRHIPTKIRLFKDFLLNQLQIITTS